MPRITAKRVEGRRAISSSPAISTKGGQDCWSAEDIGSFYLQRIIACSRFFAAKNTKHAKGRATKR